MEMLATIEVRGEVLHAGSAEVIPADGVCIFNGGLYVDGERRGRNALVRDIDAEHVYFYDNPAPEHVIVHATRIDCVLEL